MPEDSLKIDIGNVLALKNQQRANRSPKFSPGRLPRAENDPAPKERDSRPHNIYFEPPK